MLIHVNDAVTLQGARALRQPLIIPYGIHQEYELQIVTGHDNRPVDVESRGCVKWTLTITPSPETPTKVLAYAVFAENIATGSYLRFDLAATSVEMYKHVAGNPATPAVLQLQGFTEEDAPATLVITLPVALVTTAQQRLPVDLSTALMQELQLAVSVVGAAQREISKYAGDSTDAADRAEQAAINAHASEVNAEHSATAAGVSAGNARESETAAETAQAKAETAQGKAEDAQTAAETAQGKAELAQGKAEDAQSAAETAQSKAEDAQAAAETAQSKAEDAQQAAETAQTAAETAQGKAEDAQTAAEAAQTAAETAQGKAEDAQTAAETAQGKAEDAQQSAETAQGLAEDAKTAAETAQGKAEDAQIAAETAQGKAEDAQTAAETAQTAAETAQGKAEDAQDAAEAAQTAAETAQGKAEDAQTAAETAQGKAEDAQQAAETAQGLAETAQGKAEDAQTAAEAAQTAAETAQGKAEDAQDAAEAAQGAAEAAQDAAEGAEDAAAASAKLSESWAKGDTGVRDDEDTNNAKYWAEQSMSFSPITKADKVTGGDTDGMVAGLDATGNLTNTNIPSGNVAQKDGYYGSEGLGAATAENLIDPNATPEPASFGFRTAAGDLSITDGKGVVHTQFGSTEIVNQIVAPSSVKTVQGEGVVQVEDAVGGQAKGLVLTAPRSVVLNQQATATQDVTATGDGVVQLENSAAGNATALKMTAPRAVVVNQFVTFDNGMITANGLCTVVVDNPAKSVTATVNGSNVNNGINILGCAPINGHTYIISGYATASKAVTLRALYSGVISSTQEQAISASKRTFFSLKCSMSVDYTRFILYYDVLGAMVADDTIVAENMQIVDLTQYFNGDATLIDSIQSWDDLVAYDPRFVQYVEYNTGTVEGVQPTVKVTGKNLFDKNAEGIISNKYLDSHGVYVNESGFSVTDYIPVAPNTTITASYSSYSGYVSHMVFYDKDKNVLNAVINNHVLTKTYTTPSRCCFVKDSIRTVDINTYQLELGSAATAYEPYHDGGTTQAPAPLFAVGSAADEFEAVAGVTTRKMGSYTFTGNETFTMISSSPGIFSTSNGVPAGMKVGTARIICDAYVYGKADYWVKMPDKSVNRNGASGENIFFRDSSFTDVPSFAAHMTGKTIYYELATPTTSQPTPTQITLQAGSNVAMQTDGGRVASLSSTYPATVYDKAILPSRTYLYKHGSTVTKISSQSTVTLDGSDQLVDLTQLFNNDTTAVAAVNTWTDLVSRVPAYAATMAYNPGVVTGTMPAVKVMGKNLFDKTQTLTNGYLKDDGTTGSDSVWRITDYISVIPNMQYAITYPVGSGVSASLCFYDANKQFISGVAHATNGTSKTYTTPTNCCYIRDSVLDATINGYQIELGSVTTAYEPYFDGGSVMAPSTMYGVGSVADTFDALVGKTGRNIGSYTFTGNETWTLGVNSGVSYNSYWFGVSGKKNGLTNLMLADFTTSQGASWTSLASMECIGASSGASVYVKNDAWTTPEQVAAGMAGKTIYYELATPTEESSAPQPVSFQQGDNVITQSSQDLPGVAISADYDGTEYDLKLVNGSKYVIVDNGVASYRTASSSNNTLPVHGGSTMVHNLTQWFGKGYEPASVDAFYARYPSLKGYAMPYNRGSVLNYKGTAVRTEGFNFYNPATGQARLLGGNQYQICGTYTSCSYTDRWGNTEELDIDEEGIFTPVNNGTLTVVGGNATDTCVHLTWSGYKNFGKDEYKWEPFWQVTTPLDVLESFPEGMNGLGGVADEYTATGYVLRFGTVDLATLTWTWTNSNTYGYWQCSSSFAEPIKRPPSGVAANMKSPLYRTIRADAIYGNEESVDCIGIPNSGMMRVNNGSNAVQPTGILVYELATPVTVTFPETRLISYPVSDFGTEELLPADDEPGIPTTTWFNGRIQYEQDFLRLLINYSKIYSVVKHIADNADHLVYDDDTAPNLIAGNAYNLIDREAQGTMREFSYDSVNGTNDVTDGTAIAQSVLGQTLMANQLVQDSVRKTAQGTGQVEVEDAVAGDISSLVVEGRSLVKNQLVPPTMTNTKNSSDGRLGITDGVAGNAVGVTLRGGCVVHNQLVKDSIEKTVTGTGRLGCSDGVAGNAESFVMTAPRSVVMNQLVENGDFETNNWSGTHIASSSVTDNVMSFTVNAQAGYRGKNLPKIYEGHVYIFSVEMKVPYTEVAIKILANLSTVRSIYATNSVVQSGTFGRVSGKWTSTVTTTNVVYRLLDNSTSNWQELQFRNAMAVDLTQYFNGDTTLINSITSWDDLVAYDSSFASYAPYNTGTVQGVTPSVKVNHATDVTCPVELLGVSDTVGDSFDGVSGVLSRRTARLDASSLVWTAGDGTYSTTLQDILPDTTDVLSDRGYTVSVSGTTLTVTSASSPTGYIVYPLAEPTTQQYNPTTIPTVDIYNSAVQTAGTRQCPLSLTYDGREQTIALDPTHTYVFLDNMTDSSLVTEQSSIEAVGGEDMLVNVTQLYNGDSSKISQIKRWASLSTRFHRYRELLPYNPGTVEPDTPVVRVFPNEHAYGAVYDPSLSSPTLKWVELNNGVITEKASFEEFSSTPCHDIWRCVMDDLATRHVNYYLDDEDSNKKYNGTRLGVTSDGSASVLTGEDGDVMSRFPVSHWYMDEDYEGEGKVLWLISDRPFMGTWAPSEIHDFFYVGSGGGTPSDQFVGSFKAVICDEDGAALNTTEGALAQATGTASTNKVRSVAGALPFVSASLDTMEIKARRNGGHMTNTKFLQWLTLLMVIEEGTLNTQAEHAGYSNGIQNAFCFWRKSGRVNAGNGTAEIFADENSQDMDNFQSLKVGSTTVQRDTLRDADGRYAWSVYNRGATSTRYFTDSPTPANGDTVYSESTGDTTAGTVSSYTIKSATARVIQWQYRGVENPFGETWTFEHGIQVYNDAALSVIRVNNVNYTRYPSMDGPASRAFVHEGEYRWVGLTLPSNVHAFLDADLTQDSGYVASANAYVKYHNGYWETLDTDAYTMTAQQTAGNPAYTWRAFPWAAANGYVKKFDPVTFFAITVGGAATTYLCDYYWTTTNGSRVVYVGGSATNGSYAGLAYRNVAYGLTNAYVYISGRLSAGRGDA